MKKLHNILIIDPVDERRRLKSKIANGRKKFSAEETGDTEKGRIMFFEGQWDLVILGHCKDIDVVKFAVKIYNIKPGIPIVLVTSRDSSHKHTHPFRIVISERDGLVKRFNDILDRL